MKYIIRSTDHGKRISKEGIDEKINMAKGQILDFGLQYVEYQAVLGSLDPMGNRIEEQVIVIEDAGGDSLV